MYAGVPANTPVRVSVALVTVAVERAVRARYLPSRPTREPEVGHADAASSPDQHVLRLEVAVDRPIRCAATGRRRRAETRRDLGEHRAAHLEPAPQRRAGDHSNRENTRSSYVPTS